MAQVIDTVAVDTVEEGDTIRYDHKGTTLTLDVKTTDDKLKNGKWVVAIRGYSHETGDNVTVTFRPDQRVDILGS